MTNAPILDLVAGARPNFVKLAPVVRALAHEGRIVPRIIHTGQHYDTAMNDVFFNQLEIPNPHVHLEVGSGSHGTQTARILERYEEHLLRSRPDATAVFGDVNSTIACALAAVKLDIPTAHVEAGLRSFDRTMPEEINRVLTDSISDLLLVSEPSGLDNLTREGVTEDKIRLVGNVMIDSLVRELEKTDTGVFDRLGLNPGGCGLVTLHRPSNVDSQETLKTLVELFLELSLELPLVFPVHPRTSNAMDKAGLRINDTADHHLLCTAPLPYRDLLALMKDARVVLTDSGGMQEETSFLKVPCITLRENTERPITVERGTSRLVGNEPHRIRRAFRDVIEGKWPTGDDIPLWDGRAAYRVAHELRSWLSNRGAGPE